MWLPWFPAARTYSITKKNSIHFVLSYSCNTRVIEQNAIMHVQIFVNVPLILTILALCCIPQTALERVKDR